MTDRATTDGRAVSRLAALTAYNLVDTDWVPDLEPLLRIAAFVTGTPTAAVNLLDESRQWAIAALGLPRTEQPIGTAMCRVAVESGDVVYTADASEDARFSASPWVTGEIGRVRRYASAPLRDPAGHVLGTLCVFDEVGGVLDEGQLAVLADLADQAVTVLELRRQAHQLGEALRRQAGLEAQQRQAARRLAHLATHDSLTGLPNRLLLMDRLSLALAETGHGVPPTVFFCDLDGFKAVNDRLGHEAGDAVLSEVARRLTTAIRPEDTVARLGGDEFVVLCAGLSTPLARATVASRLRATLSEPIRVAGTTCPIGVSVGVAQGALGMTPEALLRIADQRMYREKALPAPRAGSLALR